MMNLMHVFGCGLSLSSSSVLQVIKLPGWCSPPSHIRFTCECWTYHESKKKNDLDRLYLKRLRLLYWNREEPQLSRGKRLSAFKGAGELHTHTHTELPGNGSYIFVAWLETGRLFSISGYTVSASEAEGSGWSWAIHYGSRLLSRTAWLNSLWHEAITQFLYCPV